MWEQVSQSIAGVNLDELSVNQAFLNITSSLPRRLWMYSLSENCVRCPFTRNREIAPHNHVLMKFDASRQIKWKFFDKNYGRYAFSNATPFCTVAPEDIGMFGVYNIDIKEDDWDKCIFKVTSQPVNVNLSILFALLILVLSLAVIYGSYYYWRLVRLSRLTAAERNAEIEEERPRKRCLDAFRGMTIVLMIFVNSGGGDYWWIKHSTWNGLHVADLVFPWFLWIMGVCIPISINAQMLRDRTFTKKAVLLSIFVRSVKLFLVGLCLNTAHGPHMEDIRIMGVLQRFGIAYFVVATMHVICIKPPNLYPIAILPNGRLKSALYDIYLLAFQWIAILCLTCVHLILVFGISVPGCPRGYLGPGGKQDDAKYMDCIGGATGYIDRLILGETHIYQHPTALYTYDAKPFDPEGLVGCLTTILQVFIGYQCGMTFLIYTNLKLMRLLIWSIALGMIGGILCSFSQDDGFIPINKNLWSLSFVFVTSSLAYLLFIIFYVVIDVYRYWSGTPFVYAGMNAIVMYVGHEVFHSMLPWHWHIGPMNTHFVLLLENMWNAAVWVVIAYVLHCKKIFIKI